MLAYLNHLRHNLIKKLKFSHNILHFIWTQINFLMRRVPKPFLSLCSSSSGYNHLSLDQHVKSCTPVYLSFSVCQLLYGHIPIYVQQTKFRLLSLWSIKVCLVIHAQPRIQKQDLSKNLLGFFFLLYSIVKYLALLLWFPSMSQTHS